MPLFGNVANLLAEDLNRLVRELEGRAGRKFSESARMQLADAYLTALRKGTTERSDLEMALAKTASALLRTQTVPPRMRGKAGPCSLIPIPRGSRCRRCGFPLTQHRQSAPRGYFDGD